MMVCSRRLLLIGASVTALSFGNAPLNAQPGLVSDHEADQVEDVLVLSAEGEERTYAQIREGNGRVEAIVADIGDGFHSQSGRATAGDAQLLTTNRGTVTLHAFAESVGPDAFGESPAPTAYIGNAVSQIATASGAAHAGFDNGGMLGIDVGAVATGVDAFSRVHHLHLVRQLAEGSGNVRVEAVNRADADMHQTLKNSVYSTGNANAFLGAGSIVTQSAYSGGGAGDLTGASTRLVNEAGGKLSVSVDQYGRGEGVTYSGTEIGNTLYQDVATNGDAAAEIWNRGTLSVEVRNQADARDSDTSAWSDTRIFRVIGQRAKVDDADNGAANILLENDGELVVAVSSNASATFAGSSALAQVHALGVEQESNEGTIRFINRGRFEMNGIGGARGDLSARSDNMITGVRQGGNEQLGVGGGGGGMIAPFATIDPWAGATPTSTVAFWNQAEFLISGAFGGHGNQDGAAAVTLAGVDQQVRALDDAFADAVNEDDFLVRATGSASGTGSADAFADAMGIRQTAQSRDIATAHVANSGVLAVQSNATSLSSGDTNRAVASALALDQVVSGANAMIETRNSGSLMVDAMSEANGDAVAATAESYVFGMRGRANGNGEASLLFDNEGQWQVSGTANADGGIGYVMANGLGIYESISSIDVGNSGTFTVSAVSEGGAGTRAKATGIEVATLGNVAGIVSNSGNLTIGAVSRNGSGSGFSTATGIYVGAGSDGLALVNSGQIDVLAQIAGNDGNVEATAIYLDAGRGLPPASQQGYTLRNSGAIRSRVSRDGGASFERGTILDTRVASSPVLFEMTGNGAMPSSLYGNLWLSDGTDIVVREGTTLFDGVVNADLAHRGSVSIAGNGILHMAMGSGVNTPSAAHVRDLAIAGRGVLSLDLPFEEGGSTATAPTLLHQRISADTARISDGARIRITTRTPNGLYADSYYYAGVLTAGQGEGAGLFGQGAVETPSIFLLGEAINRGGWNDGIAGDDQIDLSIRRLAFAHEAFGLTPNQRAAAGGIDAVYDPAGGMDPAFAGMVVDLLAMPDAATYQGALSTLHGAQYATYLQSLSTMGSRFNKQLAGVADCYAMVPDQADSRCGRAGRIGLWMKVDHGDERIHAEATADAPHFRGRQWQAIAGFDVAIGNHGLLGFAGGYVRNKGRFDQFGGTISGEGYQLGAYASYDSGRFFVNALTSYIDLDVDAARQIDTGRLAASATASADARIWAAAIETGIRFDLGAVKVAPYAGLDYTDTRLKSFSESSTHPGALHLRDARDEGLASEIGLRMSVPGSMLVPDLRIGWRHRFEDGRADFSASYLLEPTSIFRVTGAHRKADLATVAAGISASLGPSTHLRAGYEGWLSGGHRVHSGAITLRHSFGGNQNRPIVHEAAYSAPPPIAPRPVDRPAVSPPQVACNSEPYMLFFEWNSAHITTEAAAILESAVSAYAQCANVPVTLVGHADRSGANAYNLSLSMKRNQAVQAYLIGRGIPASAISSEAYGEDRPRVATADGVREHQNRRVEIRYGSGPLQ